MKAKVVKAFPGRPDKEAMTRTITVGEIIDGDLAEVAVREKWAKPHRDNAEIASEKAAKDAAAEAKADQQAAEKTATTEAEKNAAEGDGKSIDQ
ncbi:hypothetical protein [Ciceribacter thiooxidans]|uniref:Uncharacterized protein n=1 Tax=Ciceribacter thiooxidans TaxID=1969821 RepID=A0ABV7I2C0_9HYPH|nr:hypothetical protein [Ciceribacter thiooxidans]